MAPVFEIELGLTVNISLDKRSRARQQPLTNLLLSPTTTTTKDETIMSLRRYTTSVDGSIPVQALLYNDEEFLSSQDGVGIYDG